MNEIYFEGYGYFQVNTDDYDEAVDKLLRALSDAGIDFIMDRMELRDKDCNVIDG